MESSEQLTLGLYAVRLGGGVQAHHLRILANKKLIPCTRAGRVFLLRLADLEAIRAVCADRGYYTAAPSEVFHA